MVYSSVPIDRGWAWMIGFGACVQNIILLGVLKSFGIVLVEIIEEFGSSSSMASAIISVQSTCHGFTVPVVLHILTAIFSIRQVMLCGSVIASLGVGLGFFAMNVEFLLFTYGALLGIGNACLYAPSLVMIGQYFDKRRGLVTALAVAGGSVGQLTAPPVIRYLFDTYGFRGGLLLMSALTLHCAVTSSLMRPVSYYTHNAEIENSKPRTLCCNKGSNESVTQEQLEPLEKNTSNGVVSKMQNGDTESDEKTSCANLIELSLLKNVKFILLLLSSCLGTVGAIYIGMYIPPHAKDLGFKDHQIVWFITIIGASDLVGRVACGALADTRIIQCQNLLIASFLINGLFGNLVFSLSRYWHFCVFCVMYGLLGSHYFSLISLILVDFFGLKMLTKSFGFLIFLEAITNGIGPLILGYLRDETGDYLASFYYMGNTSILAAFILFTTRFFHSNLIYRKPSIVVDPENNKSLLKSPVS
ncbi:monocarboxylate transporter 3 [Patella vulgata]|uniref:monocarboxylate transporter 3 n=1 Tax=Patella vulgata TaxID=6465 RepID=UPI0021800AB5|nr:monocarboxylate transporter 3 [Patella vulgata]XP_050394604.1 monocarboxylate transporter 3 [Patella vulgata]